MSRRWRIALLAALVPLGCAPLAVPSGESPPVSPAPVPAAAATTGPASPDPAATASPEPAPTATPSPVPTVDVSLAGGFPPDFAFGVAVAAHQVEGGNTANDWSDWEQVAGKIRDGSTAGEAAAFWRTYAQDAALARDMGLDAFRLSIEWSRIEPEQGVRDEEALAHYGAILDALRAAGLRPFVTLCHFTLPRWVAARGGWESPQTADDFAAFARLCGARFGNRVDDWITINEPNVYALNGYVTGWWPPGKEVQIETALKVIAAQLGGHARAAAALREADTAAATPGGPPTRIGLAHNLTVLEASDATNSAEVANAAAQDQVFNRMALDAFETGVVSGRLGLDRVNVAIPDLPGSADFVGINYYTRRLIKGVSLGNFVNPPGATVSDLEWEVYPAGLFGFLDRLRAQPLPVVITENGIADAADRLRTGYLVRHLMEVRRALAAGADVRGYFHWSLMDNFEWHEGYRARFGLYRVDRASAASREPTAAVALLREIATGRALTPDHIRAYAP